MRNDNRVFSLSNLLKSTNQNITKELKTIGILTSGGDSPGMNAAVRASVRTACYLGHDIYAVRNGYKGLIEGRIQRLETTDVSDIIQRGGTVLKSARSEEFRTPEGRKKAADVMEKNNMDALITVGGDGTFRGAKLLADEHNINVIGVPATIDNDLVGTDESIGYDTALNTAMEAIDKVRDTADAHERVFFVEVMGRDVGFIALETGIAVGAELILLPETLTHPEEVQSSLKEILKVQKRSTLVVVAEGDETGGALKLCATLEKDLEDYDMKVCILGHVQRGGNPTARDRVLASRLGAHAVQALHDGHSKVMVGVVNGKIKLTPISDTFGKKKQINFDLIKLSNILK